MNTVKYKYLYAIVQIIKRRPSVEDLSTSLGLHPLEANKYVDVLVREHIVLSRKTKRGSFLKLVK